VKKGLIVILVGGIISVVFASSVVISKPRVFIKESFLTTSFKIQNLLGEKEIKTIESGFITTIIIKIELWQKGRLFHTLKTTRQITQEILYNIWEKIYTLRLDKNKILKFDNLGDLKKVLNQEEMVLIRPIRELDNKKSYFVRVKVDLESINKKQLEELSEQINGHSQDLINIKEIFYILVKHQTKNIKSYAQSDDFKLNKLREIRE